MGAVAALAASSAIEASGDSSGRDVAIERHRATRAAGAEIAARALEADYGPYAEAVLGPRPHIEADADGFELVSREIAETASAPVASSSAAPTNFRMRLPRSGDEPVTFQIDGHEVRVTEIGVNGSAERTEGAITYAREGGRIYWTESENGGYEEWLDIEAGRAYADRPIARWRVEGASLREHGDKVIVADARGTPKMLVSAPRAWARDGRAVDAKLSVVGSDILLSVDANGDAVLVDPSWETVASMVEARVEHSSTLLQDGRVLVAGGRFGTGPWVSAPNATISSVEIYDPVANTWTAVAPMPGKRRLHAAALLPGNKVLVAGGQGDGDLDSAFIYDVATDTWTPAASTPTAAHWRVGTPLGDGRVLVTGGDRSGAVSDAFIYDPVADAWTTAAPMNFNRRHHRAVLLDDGRVLVVGGNSGTGSDKSGLPSAEVYDPVTNTWTETNPMAEGHAQPAVVKLSDGRVLVAGGLDTSAGHTAAVEIYDPATNSWTSVAPLPTARAYAQAFQFGNGKVLVVGGENRDSGESLLFFYETALYDIASDTWTAGPAAAESHDIVFTGIQLDANRVLVAGGNIQSAWANTTTVTEIFHAVDPNGTLCTDGRDCASGFCVDGYCCNSACDGQCETCSALYGAPEHGTCGPVTAGTECDDGNTCTQSDVCTAEGICQGEPIAGACLCPPGTSSPDGSELTGCVPCEDGTFSGEGATSCTPWTECGDEEYESTAPSATNDRVCTACTVCEAGTVEASPCTETADRVCVPVETDAGTGSSDAGTGPRDAGTDPRDAGTQPVDGGIQPVADGGMQQPSGDDGCNCSSVGAGRDMPTAGLALVVMALGLVLRRRRR